MAVDYEAEYNNRARVPDHAEIFARWARDGAAYRAEATTEGRAEIGLKYGPSPRQTIDLFRPCGGDGPLAMFIHGGYWRAFDPSSFSQMARGLNARGIVVAMPGHDLCPQATIGQIVEQIQAACLFLWRRFKRRIMVSGHSAGGHLAACMIATDWNRLDAVVGAQESSEFLRQSRIVSDGWREKGVETRYEAVPGTNHFTICDAMLDPDSAMTQRLAVLAAIAEKR
jgi:arylformamidase